jgi:hypothetical protein
MKITRIVPVEHRMFPIEFYKDDRGEDFPYFIDRDEHMEDISPEKHEADFKTFIDGIYENRPKGFAVTCKGRFFGYEKPEEAKAGHRSMFSKAQLLNWANSVYRKAHFEEQEYSLEGEYYYLRREDHEVKVEPTGAYKQVHCTSVDALTSGNPTWSWCTDEYITKENIFTNGEGVFFLEGYSIPYIFFNSREIAEKFAAQVNEGNFDELRKLSNDAWSAIQAYRAAAKRAEDEAREAERQERIKAREAKEAERLSKVNKDSLVLSKDCIALGNWYVAIINGNIRRFMAAGSHEGTTVGVYQKWSGSSYDETLNAELKWFMVESHMPIFGSVDDAQDYQKLSSH